MASFRLALKASSLLLAVTLAGCDLGMDETDPRYPEMEQANQWMKRLKAGDPDTGALLAQECADEHGFRLSNDGLLELTRCMRRKYDEGVRAEGSEDVTIA